MVQIPYVNLCWEIIRRMTGAAAIVFLVLLPKLVAGTAVAPAQGSRLTEIHVTGSNTFTEAEIIKAAGLKLGQTVTPDQFKEAANRLGNSGLFASVNYRYHSVKGGIGVDFQVAENPNLMPCAFANFVWFSRQELLDALKQRVPLFTGKVPETGNQAQQVADALTNLLMEHAIAGRVAFDSAIPPSGGLAAMLFRVEGVRIMVRDVQFTGVTQFPSSILARYSGALVGNEFDPGTTQQFVASNLRLIYGEKGYLKAEIAEAVPEVTKRDATETAVRLTVPVHEGLQYHWKDVRWSGAAVLTPETLARDFQLRAGEIADESVLEKGLAAIRMVYGTRGYLRANIVPQPSFDDAARTVSYEMQVSEGDIHRMGQLTVSGLDLEVSSRIIQGCRLHSGDVYDKTYWNGFLEAASPSLPANYAGWRGKVRESISDESKTVSVEIHYAPGRS